MATLTKITPSEDPEEDIFSELKPAQKAWLATLTEAEILDLFTPETLQEMIKHCGIVKH